MRIRPLHVLHSLVTVVVLVQMGFAAAFLVDAATTDATYDALAAHHVVVGGHIVGCLPLRGVRGAVAVSLCRDDYRYRSVLYSDVIPLGETTSFVVDPRHPADRMDVAAFAKGPEETTGDLVFAGVLLASALMMVVVHLEHLRQRRRRSELRRPVPSRAPRSSPPSR